MRTIRLLVVLGIVSVTTIPAKSGYDYFGLVGDAAPAGWNPGGVAFTAEDETTTKTYTVNFTVDEPSYYENLYMIGSATEANWDITNLLPMIMDSENPAIFTWEDTLITGQFKIVAFTGEWCLGDEIVPTQDNQVLTATDYEINAECTGNDHKWLVDTAGVYNVTVDLDQETITINRLYEITTNYDSIFLVGDATPVGWNISEPEPMVKDNDNDKLFTWEGNLTTGELKFSTFKGDWCDGDWLLATAADQSLSATDYKIYSGCAPENEDFKWKVNEVDTGAYIITVDLENETIVFDKQEISVIDNSVQSNFLVYPNPAYEILQINTDMDQWAL